MSERYERLHSGGGVKDQRLAAQRDRDRIIHSSALRRLGGVTQVVDPSEGYVFHNRLTHTLKVAQIARRLAEKLSSEQAEEAAALGGIDSEIVETGALAHDLGHPPFGHIAETELDKQVVRADDADGFEGNAQSFRIINKLAIRQSDVPGLNLTRAALNASLKYPWFRETSGFRHKKWGAYRTEEKEFFWAREPHQEKKRTVEAELMDWADDIAYAVHDMEDFYRAGLIPLHLLALYPRERDRFLDANNTMLEERSRTRGYSVEELGERFHKLLSWLPIEESYAGSRQQRAALRLCTGNLIRQYVFGIRLTPDADRAVQVDQEYEMEIFLLKQLTRHFVIDSPRLATQQYGKAKVISGLFEVLMDAASAKETSWRDILPIRCREEMEIAHDSPGRSSDARLIADVVSSLSDREALMLYRRFLGTEPGSALENIVI